MFPKTKEGRIAINQKQQLARFNYMNMVTKRRQGQMQRHVAELNLLARRLPQAPTFTIDFSKIPDNAAPRAQDPYKQAREDAEQEENVKVQRWRECLINLIHGRPEVNTFDEEMVTHVINNELPREWILQQAGVYEKAADAEKETIKTSLFKRIQFLVERKQPKTPGGFFNGFNPLKLGIGVK